MAKSKHGKVIPEALCTGDCKAKLIEFIAQSKRANDLLAWQRGTAVLAYINGKTVVELASSLPAARSAINKWLRWYRTMGVDGLRKRVAPGKAPLLTDGQRQELMTAIEAGPREAGYTSGVWTGPMVGDLIAQRFGVQYHNHSVPRLLATLGFSVQRPRKKLAKGDAARQLDWVENRLPEIKKKPMNAAGL